MNTSPLKHDPYNLIITGVGGQGNVLASRMVGALCATNELPITGEAFETVIRQRMPADKVDLNLEAFEIGRRLVA